MFLAVIASARCIVVGAEGCYCRTYSQTCRTDVSSQILLRDSPIAKFVARRDDPETNHRVGTHPTVHFKILVLLGVLILIVHLQDHSYMIDEESCCNKRLLW